MPGWLVGRVAKQLIAAIAMGAALYGIKLLLGDMFYGSGIEKILGVGALVGTGAWSISLWPGRSAGSTARLS